MAPCQCLDRHINLKNPTKCMAWEPDHRSNFFFSTPAHLCAVACITEIILNMTLSKEYIHLSIYVLYMHNIYITYNILHGHFNLKLSCSLLKTKTLICKYPSCSCLMSLISSLFLSCFYSVLGFSLQMSYQRVSDHPRFTYPHW